MRLSATVVAENSLKSALQLTQVKALSGEEALHLEQVCMAELQRFFVIASVFPEKEQPDFNTNKIAQAGACAGILEKSPRLRSEQFSV
jgi:hypothetical protein